MDIKVSTARKAELESLVEDTTVSSTMINDSTSEDLERVMKEVRKKADDDYIDVRVTVAICEGNTYDSPCGMQRSRDARLLNGLVGVPNASEYPHLGFNQPDAQMPFAKYEGKEHYSLDMDLLLGYKTKITPPLGPHGWTPASKEELQMFLELEEMYDSQNEAEITYLKRFKEDHPALAERFFDSVKVNSERDVTGITVYHVNIYSKERLRMLENTGVPLVIKP